MGDGSILLCHLNRLLFYIVINLMKAGESYISVFMWQMSEFNFNLFLLLTINNIYCDWRGRIFWFLNKSLHESLTLAACNNSNYILLYFKNLYTMWRVPPQQASIVHNGIKTGRANHPQCFLWHKGHNWSHYVASCT